MPVVELFLKVFLGSFLYPFAMEFARRREADPVFKAEIDSAYGELEVSKSTAARWAALEKIRVLDKGQKKSD